MPTSPVNSNRDPIDVEIAPPRGGLPWPPHAEADRSAARAIAAVAPAE